MYRSLDEDLRLVLAGYSASVRPLEAPQALGNAGGLSGARLWRFTAGQELLAARAWPPEGPDRAALERIHQWLAETSLLGFVPVPVPARDGATICEQGGRLWEVVPWMPGSAEQASPPAPARLRAGFAGLAAFHQCLAHHQTRGPSPGLEHRLAELDSLTTGGYRQIESLLARSAADPLTPLAQRWLKLAQARTPAVAELLRAVAGLDVVLQPCLRDVRGEHLLFEGERLSGIVDFGAMDLENTAADLARLLADWVGPDRSARACALAAYANVRPLGDQEISLIEVFTRSAALLGGGLWVRWHFLEGRSFDDPQAVRRGLQKCLERLGSLP